MIWMTVGYCRDCAEVHVGRNERVYDHRCTALVCVDPTPDDGNEHDHRTCFGTVGPMPAHQATLIEAAFRVGGWDAVTALPFVLMNDMGNKYIGDP